MSAAGTGEPPRAPALHDSAVDAAQPLRRDAERNRQRILQAAQEVFATQGLGARMDEIAQVAGVGVGTLYRRFPSKEDLVEAIFEARVGEIIDVAERAVQVPSGWDGLVLFLHEVSALQAGDRGLREIALSTGFGRSHVASLRARVVVLLQQLIARARTEGVLRAEITDTDVPLLLFMVGEVAQNSTGFRPDLARRYLDLLIDGLRAHPQDTDLGHPLDDADLERFMQGWGPSPR